VAKMLRLGGGGESEQTFRRRRQIVNDVTVGTYNPIINDIADLKPVIKSPGVGDGVAANRVGMEGGMVVRDVVVAADRRGWLLYTSGVKQGRSAVNRPRANASRRISNGRYTLVSTIYGPRVLKNGVAHLIKPAVFFFLSLF